VTTVSELEMRNPRMTSGALLTVEEAAAFLNVPSSWVYERTRRRSVDRLPGIRLGKYWRFREADLLAWIEGQRVGGRANA
jgi:excisionase family DNA binding protein